MEAIYTARATAYGDGRNGHVTSDDDVLDVDLAIPKEMGGPGGELSNPEQLFAAGYAACFHSALKIVAKKVGVSTEGSTVAASVGIGPDGDAYGLQVTLAVELPSAGRDEGEKALEAAHQVCPYSRATRGNIQVTLQLV
ncbi:MAG: lipoyl-dependent peroxiredoxin [Frankiaceae bacterium]|nr:lipoyl-dependent peroxiredoxin [Frankiaceae bacterium]